MILFIYLKCTGKWECGEDVVVQIDNVPDMTIKYQKTYYTEMIVKWTRVGTLPN